MRNNTAVIVAHPDDETLWASSKINPGVDVICCTVPRRDPERAIRFFEAVRILGGYPILIPFVESAADDPIPHLDVLDISMYGAIITHNARGEYGHVHHKQVSQYVRDRHKGTLMTFGYGSGDLVECDKERKLEALKAYDHQSNADGGLPKWKALIERYNLDLGKEYFNVER